jgi:hypothetical protein
MSIIPIPVDVILRRTSMSVLVLASMFFLVLFLAMPVPSLSFGVIYLIICVRTTRLVVFVQVKKFDLRLFFFLSL